MTHKVFIDGEAGTTGLMIRERLQNRSEISLISLSDTLRKDEAARRDAINSADAVILCLPDEAARAAVSLCENSDTVIIDASTAHRVTEGWTYGFPELTPEQRVAIAGSKRISNPGCYATGFIALMRPLVNEGLIPPFWPTTCNAVSGYTGGGKSMIAEFEKSAEDGATDDVYRIYATNLNHKHLPEMTEYAGLDSPPLFTPAVGRFPQGMIVEIPLQLWALPTEPDIAEVHAVLSRYYAHEDFIDVASLEDSHATKTLAGHEMAGQNGLKIRVFGDVEAQQVRLVASLDNLGKGASGAAVQNLNIVLGLPENSGLV